MIDWDLITKNQKFSSVEEMIRTLYFQERSSNKVSKILLVNNASVLSQMDKFGIKRIFKGNRGSKNQDKFFAFIDQVDTSCLTADEISESLKMPKHTIHYLCRKYKVAYRKKGKGQTRRKDKEIEYRPIFATDESIMVHCNTCG